MKYGTRFSSALAVITLIAGLTAPAAAPLELSSSITDVTVYTDRAEIRRVAKKELDAGERVVAFRGLPDALDQNSIQVNGSGPAVLQDIRFERRQLSETPHEKIRKLELELQQLNDSARAIDDDMKHAQSEIAFVQNIADGLTKNGPKEVPIELDPGKWAQMVSFYRGKVDALDRQVRSDQNRRREVALEIDRVQREHAELSQGGRKVSNDVEVTLAVKKDGAITLELTYIVYGPSWNPLYDLRVSSDTKAMEVTYKAQVRQSTSEEWKNVKVKLSTASPQQGGSHPELSPWHLSYYEPVRGYLDSDRRARGAAPAMNQMMNVYDAEMAKEEAEAPPEPMEVATAQVETRSTSVVFVPEARTMIANDNQPSTVVISVMSFPAHFRYSTVPKLSQHAYLKAKAKNTTAYPLLPGPANVFFDNAFVTSTEMKLVAPTEEFWTFLGIDEAIAVEYKLIKRFEEEMGKKQKVTWEYQIVLENKKKTSEELVVWDQLPISGGEEIEVECIQPVLKENSEALKKNEHEFLEWYFKLEPGKKMTVPFSFSVKYPKGKTIQGL